MDLVDSFRKVYKERNDHDHHALPFAIASLSGVVVQHQTLQWLLAMSDAIPVMGQVTILPIGRAVLDIAFKPKDDADVRVNLQPHTRPPHALEAPPFSCPSVKKVIDDVSTGTLYCHDSRLPPCRSMISDLIRAIQKELGLQPLGKNGGWSQEAQDVFVNKLKTERKKRKRMKVEERLLDDASVDSAQRKHG